MNFHIFIYREATGRAHRCTGGHTGAVLRGIMLVPPLALGISGRRASFGSKDATRGSWPYY